MGEPAKRAITGAAYVALTLGAALAGPFTTTLLFLPVCGLAAFEFHRLAWGDEPHAPRPIAVVMSAVVVYLSIACCAFVPLWTASLAAAAALAVFAIASAGMLLRAPADPAKELGTWLATLFYIALPFGLTAHLLEGGPHLFIGCMLLLWTNDTGAYITGRTLGSMKLMPHVSPKKTVEGTIGGVLLAVALGVELAHAWPELTVIGWTTAAVAVAILATLGDLLESSLKRAGGVKDSGKVLPGHGGILDRFDGFLLALPGMYLVIHLVR